MPSSSETPRRKQRGIFLQAKNHTVASHREFNPRAAIQ